MPSSAGTPLSRNKRSIHCARSLPADQPIILFCGAGGRSGEAYDMVKLYKPGIKTVFLDAEIKWTKDGGYSIKGQ